MTTTTASHVCQQLLNQLRLSNLNFIVSETPYSAQIFLRKRFLKELNGPEPDFNSYCEVQIQVEALREENNTLRNEISDLKLSSASEKETIKLLEDKLARAEEASLKIFEKAKLDTSTLKNVNKNQNKELEECRRDLNNKVKILKQKEKEIQKLDSKCENLNINLKAAKSELKMTKSDLDKEKKIKVSKKKLSDKEFTNESNNNRNGEFKEPSLGKEVLATDIISSTASVSPSNTPPGSPPSPTKPLDSNLEIRNVSIAASCSGVNSVQLFPLKPPTAETPTQPPPTQSTMASPSTAITADYITGINQINLGPRLNDLSKF